MIIIVDIYTSGKNFTKSKHYEAMVHKALNTLTIRDKKEHSRRRRVISQGFSDSALRSYAPAMMKLINQFCDHLVQSTTSSTTDEWQSPQNMSKWCK